jgi:NAD(P)-dependent dehydrogenase (short-subunit alcohol dehydrogenase family)
MDAATTTLTGGAGAVALVTGGGFNIGRAVAIRLAAAGARVVVAARRQAGLDATVAAIRNAGGEALAVATDVVDPQAVERLVARAVDAFGTVDILVAAAGGGGAHEPVDAVDPAAWTEVFANNVFGTFHAARAALPHMRRHNRGVILTFAGGGAFFPVLGAHLTAYATAKAALCRFTDQLQAELLDTNIRVHCLDPGMVWSPERLAEVRAEEQRSGTEHPERPHNRAPDDAAELALFLASSAGAGLRGRVLSVDDDWWRDPEQVRAVEATVNLYRLRRDTGV